MRSDVRMNDGKDLEGSGYGVIEVLFQNLPGERGRPVKTSVRIAGVPSKIRTEHLPNTYLEVYI
jgi:hypothetical protein